MNLHNHTQKIITYCSDVWVQLFDHKTFLQSEINSFIKNFEETRHNREVENLLDCLHVQQCELRKQCNQIDTCEKNSLKQLYSKVEYSLQQADNILSNTSIDKSVLIKNRLYRTNKWNDFQKNLKLKYSETESKNKANIQELKNIYEEKNELLISPQT